MEPVAVPFVAKVVSSTDVGRRNERELRTLAEIVDRTSVGDVAGAGGVAVQRLKAALRVSRKDQKGPSGKLARAQALGAHPIRRPSSFFSRNELRGAARREAAEQRLDKPTR